MKIKSFKNNCLLIILVIGLNSCSSDSTLEDPIQITVSTSDFTTSMDENPATGQIIGTVTGSTNQGSVTFSITEQSPSGAFAIDSNTGELTVADEFLFNFEVNPTITGTVKVANGDVFENSNITIGVNDLNEENIYYGDIELNTQQDVNEFGSNNYTDISGFLYINSYFGNVDINITDLSPLSSIKTVGNYFSIFGYDIINLNDLSLEHIGEGIYISYCTSLTNIDGLSSVTSVLGGIHIEGNPLINNINGINNINNLGGDLKILLNDNLSNIEGLNNLHTINGNMKFIGNDNLSNLEGLNNLQNVGGELALYGNDILNDFCGISSLIISNGLIGDYTVENNAYNPTVQDILDGNCSL